MNWLHPRRRPRRPPRRPTRILLLLGSICIQALRPTRAKVRRGSLIEELCNPPDLEPNRELMRVRFKNEGGLEIEDDPKNEDGLKNKDNLKMKTN